MIEVRVFATLRIGRDKISRFPAEDLPDAAALMKKLDIPAEDVAIILINGFHSKPESPVKDGDIVSLFPPVAGG